MTAADGLQAAVTVREEAEGPAGDEEKNVSCSDILDKRGTAFFSFFLEESEEVD